MNGKATTTGSDFPQPFEEKRNQETGSRFAPRFDASGLMTCVAVDAATKDVLMVAFVNAEALSATLETGVMHYWSRSRGELWKKGATSGQLQTVVELRTDCDQDALVALVTVGGDGGACHVGYRSCFYRAIERSPDTGEIALRFLAEPIADSDSA